ncbi:phytase [Terricaulis silvestris]|uniref:phytase n=1 Tax=Terricaulis silvestris TaxID=2686094 RepID=UPI00131AE31F
MSIGARIEANDAPNPPTRASVQGASLFAIYERAGSNAYRGAFMIGASNRADGVSGTDGAACVRDLYCRIVGSR